MLRALLDITLRISSGLGLLLLLAAHGEACAWFEPPAENPDARQAADPRTDDQSSGDEPAEPPRPTLVSFLPDIAAPPRRPAPSESGTVLPLERRDVTAAECGTRVEGPPRAVPGKVFGYPIAHRLTEILVLAGEPTGTAWYQAGSAPTDPSLGTAILVIGPPRV